MGIVDDAVASADWIASALRSSGYGADFSPRSIWEVERFFEDQAPDGRARPGGLLSESLGQRLFAVGSYVGEVLRRELGGQWAADDGDPKAEINISLVLDDGSTVWPVQRVMERFENGPEDSVAAYASVLGVSIGSRPRRQRRRFRR